MSKLESFLNNWKRQFNGWVGDEGVSGEGHEMFIWNGGDTWDVHPRWVMHLCLAENWGGTHMRSKKSTPSVGFCHFPLQTVISWQIWYNCLFVIGASYFITTGHLVITYILRDNLEPMRHKTKLDLILVLITFQELKGVLFEHFKNLKLKHRRFEVKGNYTYIIIYFLYFILCIVHILKYFQLILQSQHCLGH